MNQSRASLTNATKNEARQRAKASAARKLAAFLDAWQQGNQAAMIAHASLNWQRFNTRQGFDSLEALAQYTGKRRLLGYRFDSSAAQPSSPELLNAWDFPVTLAFQSKSRGQGRGQKWRVFEFPTVQVVCCSSRPEGGFSENPGRYGIWGACPPSLRAFPGISQAGQVPGPGRGVRPMQPRHLIALDKAKGLV